MLKGSRRDKLTVITFGAEKLEWRGSSLVKKMDDYDYSIHESNGQADCRRI